jgi:hypothetical protein
VGKYALLIGTEHYQDSKFARLQKPTADVASLASALRDSAIGAFEAVETSIDESFATVLRRIGRLFADKKPDDLLLLFFAGHGVKDESGRLHLAVTDTESSILSATALSADFLTGEMNRSRSRKQVLVLDCCFSGALTGTRASASVNATEPFTVDGVGRIILTATDSYQYAWETEEQLTTPNSVFSHHLVEGLTTGKADLNEDGIITADEWYDYTYAQVRAATPKQTPQRSVHSGAGSVVIARNPHPNVPLPDDLLDLIKSRLPSIREVAVKELARLLVDDNPGLVQSARDSLAALVQDRDQGVRALATRALNGEDVNAPTAPVVQPPTPPVLVPRPKMTMPELRRKALRIATHILVALLVGLVLAFGVVFTTIGYEQRALSHPAISHADLTLIGSVLAIVCAIGFGIQWWRPIRRTIPFRRTTLVGLGVAVIGISALVIFVLFREELPSTDTAATETRATTDTAPDTSGTTALPKSDTTLTTDTSAIVSTGTFSPAELRIVAQIAPFVSGSFDKCPPTGDGGDSLLNVLKNRDVAPPEPLDTPTVKAIIADVPPELAKVDMSRANWSKAELEAGARTEGAGVTIEGYLVQVHRESNTSANCHVQDHRGITLRLASMPNTNSQHALVATVTPRLMAKHPIWQTALPKITGKHIRVTGWRIWNQTHTRQVGKFFATSWEIHPVTNIEVQVDGAWKSLDAL